MIPIHRTWLVLAAAVAVLATPTIALGGSGATTPDWFERYAAAHPYGDTVSPAVEMRSADTLDAVADARQALLVPSDGRSPDTLDEASAPQPVILTTPGGFDWSDAGIGAGVGTGALALLFAAAAMLLRRPRRMQST
jgi:hypothetical protein